ncbi:histidine kinase dimerization/phosphoacceptor domain -containing protein [Cyclobacterium jeungdonense]|uniref:histidine kinase n=1 Tax=Cyclobacterium jeungdonense TaxID=708087 RepID=A0ABT8CAE9_9BACT|nr:histidine kinase dimerization/phosphoacceptor domain -containing protein [Cyclobacterium jeungdonense]MDN3688788.1 histidine kinase dimerization/phosphoacceptor domain -containing protein [Cyclobacterium jeungdonense]
MKFCFLLVGICSTYFSFGTPFFKNPVNYQPIFTYPPDFGSEYLESLASLAQSYQENDSLRWQVLWDWGYYTHSRNLKQSLHIIQLGLDEATRAKNSLWEGRFQLIKGAILMRMDQTEQAEILLQSAMEKVRETDLWLAYTNMGYVYERRGDLSTAFEWARNTLELGRKTGQVKARAMAYSDLSYLLWKQGKYNEGLELGLHSLDLFEKRGIPDMDFDFTLYVVANHLMALSRFDEAEKHFDKSIAMGERFAFFNNLSDVYISLTSLQIRKGELQNAEKSAYLALEYASLLENSFMQMRSLLAIGEVNLLKEEYVTAEKYFLESISEAGTDSGDHFFSRQAYLHLSETYEAIGKPKEALFAFKRYHELNRTIFNEEAEKKMATLKAALDLAQKNNTIKEQALILSKQEKQVTFWILGTTMLLVVSLITFRGYRIIKKKNRLLEEQNREKSHLVRETHHRIKNNLQVVSSLLSLQSEHIQDPQLQQIMLDSQSRVQSMGLVHQTLYQGKDLAYIEMKDYFTKLSEDVINSFGAKGKANLYCEMGKITLDIITAIPIGLIINELMTNSLKYAFPEKELGSLFISLYWKGSELILDYRDDGIGFKEEEAAFSPGFGRQLIQLLSTQLNGEMNKIPDQGTRFQFVFHP